MDTQGKRRLNWSDAKTAATVLTLTSAVIRMGCCEEKTMTFAATARGMMKQMDEYIRKADAINIAESYEVRRDGFNLNDYEYGRNQVADSIASDLEDMPVADIVPAEPQEIGYDQCVNAMLKMWIDNVVTDGEYNRIMDKLNKHYGKA